MGAKKTIPVYGLWHGLSHIGHEFSSPGIKGTHWSGSNSPFDLSSCGELINGDPRPGISRMDGDFWETQWISRIFIRYI